jgi:hypothetical protein
MATERAIYVQIGDRMRALSPVALNFATFS